MKEWIPSNYECPECGDELEVLTEHKDGYVNDGDEVRCQFCDFTSCIDVDDDGRGFVI